MRRHRELLWDAVLALFVLAAAVVLVRYLGVHGDRAPGAGEAEDRAVEAVQRLGGKVIRDEKAPDKPVIAVSLNTAAVTDAVLKELAGLKQLRTLDLRGTQITNTGLKELAGLQQLQELDLTDTRATCAGLQVLAGLQQLQTLSIDSRQIPASQVQGRWQLHLEGLSRLQHLKTLYVNKTHMLGQGMTKFIMHCLEKALPRCRIILRP
jgi:hypothetical protein